MPGAQSSRPHLSAQATAGADGRLPAKGRGTRVNTHKVIRRPNVAARPNAMLVVQSGMENLGAILLDGTSHLLGRFPHADIDLDNPFVSRRHAKIVFSESGYSIQDLGSSNGTFVDGARLGREPMLLSGGEIIEFGKGHVRAKFTTGFGTITVPEAAGSKYVPDRKGEAPITITSRGVAVNIATREVFINGTPLVPRLTGKDFEILAFLWESMGTARSNAEIGARAWPARPEGSVSFREIGQRIYRIRRRIEPEADAPTYIETVRGFGYRLVQDQ